MAAITHETLEAKIAELATAIGNGAYSTARQLLAQAEAYLIALPKYSTSGRSVEYNAQLASLKASLNTLESISAGARGTQRVLARCDRW